MATNTATSFTNPTAPSSGSTAGPYAIPFDYLEQSDIDVTVNGTLQALGVAYTFTSGTQITFTSGNEPPNGAAIVIRRDTDISAKKVDFQDGSVLTETDLDTNTEQILFGLQEFTDKINGIEDGATADQTPAEILAALIQVDGIDSGLDADKLDGQHGSYYLDYQNLTNAPTSLTLGNIRIGVTGANEIDTSSGALTIDSASGDTTVDDNLTVTGNLIVNGSNVSIPNAPFLSTLNPDVATGSLYFFGANTSTFPTTKIRTRNVPFEFGSPVSTTAAGGFSAGCTMRIMSNMAGITDGDLNQGILNDLNLGHANLGQPSGFSSELNSSTIGHVAQISLGRMYMTMVGNGASTFPIIMRAAYPDGLMFYHPDTTMNNGTFTSDKSGFGTNTYAENITDARNAADMRIISGGIFAKNKVEIGSSSVAGTLQLSGVNVTASAAEINIVSGMSKQTTISDSDTAFPTSGAVVDYFAARNIGDLTNVDTTGVADGKILKYQSSSNKFIIADDIGGGSGGISNVVEDTTPQLGGNLDIQTNEINTSTSNGNIKLNPNGTGVVEVKGDGSSNNGKLQLNCSQNSHGVKLESPDHSAAQSYTLKLPDNQVAANKYLKVKSITGSGATATGQLEYASLDIVDADINSSAGIDGSKLANLVSNDADNRVLTATGTTNSFNAETNLTFNGSTLGVLGSSQVIQALTTTNSNGAYVEYNLGASGAGIGYIGSGIQLVSGGSAANLAIRAEGLLQLCISNSSKLNIDSSGDVEVVDGNLKLASGHGIMFSPYDNTGTDPYGSDSNLLDDYERGSFQPAIIGTTTNPSQNTYVHQNGYYEKIGRMVHLRVDIQFASSGVTGGTGEAVLSGLPFTNSGETNAYGITMAVGYSINWYNNSCPTGGYINPSTTWLYLMPYNTNGTTFSAAANVGGGTRLIAGFTYMT